MRHQSAKPKYCAAGDGQCCCLLGCVEGVISVSEGDLKEKGYASLDHSFVDVELASS